MIDEQNVSRSLLFFFPFSFIQQRKESGGEKEGERVDTFFSFFPFVVCQQLAKKVFENSFTTTFYSFVATKITFFTTFDLKDPYCDILNARSSHLLIFY